MDISDILKLRLHNQHISSHPCTKVEDIVAWLGAVQAQDYTSAKWAIGLRADNLTDEQIEEDFSRGKILRTHVMRPTWHFVTPKDIQWMIKLSAPRVHKINSYYYRRLGLDDKLLQRSITVLVKGLQGNNYLTREEIRNKLQQEHILTTEQNLNVGYILMYAELEGIICSGPRRGKQFTYALLDERIPKAKVVEYEESLAELTKRYFQSHGPATIQDFVWWSGLTTLDAKKGLELIKSKLQKRVVEEKTYWLSTENQPIKSVDSFYLLPNFDEYIVGYSNRKDIFDYSHLRYLDARANPLFQHIILSEGKIIGTWKREFKKNHTNVDIHLFTSLVNAKKKTLAEASRNFGKYMGSLVNVEISNS